jgi:sulfonate transport system substrate-binding protein
MLTGLRTGSADIGQLGLQSPAILAEQNVGNVKIIAGFIVGAQNLITRKAAAIHSWKDLEGKKIGLAPGTYAAVLFTLAARENNVDISKINLINTTASGTVELQALKNGDLDGFVLYSPIIDRAVIEGFAEYPPCCDIGSTKKFGSDNQLFAANADFLKDRTTVVKLLKAYVEAEQYYIANSGKALDITGQYTGVPKEVLVEAMKHFAWDHRVDLKAAVSVAQEGPTFGFTKADMSGKVPAYFDLSFLSEATGKPVNQLDTFGH